MSLERNLISISAPRGRGDGMESMEVPDGGDASVLFTLRDPENEADTAGIILMVSDTPFSGECDPFDSSIRAYPRGMPDGERPLDLSDPFYRLGSTYYVRGCPITSDLFSLSGPPTNTVEVTLIASLASGGIAMELPGENILTVEGRGARVDLLFPKYDSMRYADLERFPPTFNYNFGHPDSGHATAGVIEIKETPFARDTCPEQVDPDARILPAAPEYYAGTSSVRGEPLRVLEDKALPNTFYVRACPIAEDGGGPYWAGPPANAVQVSYRPG